MARPISVGNQLSQGARIGLPKSVRRRPQAPSSGVGVGVRSDAGVLGEHREGPIAAKSATFDSVIISTHAAASKAAASPASMNPTSTPLPSRTVKQTMDRTCSMAIATIAGA